MIIRKYTEKDISEMVHIWNEVVEDGEAFPQEEFLDDKTLSSCTEKNKSRHLNNLLTDGTLPCVTRL